MKKTTMCMLLGAVLAFLAAAAQAEDNAGNATAWSLPDAHDVRLGGELGEAYQKGIARLGQEPYSSVVFLRSDVSFEMERWFTNYSGDISGRFIEVASLTSPRGKMAPATLPELLKTVLNYQKADGHFGIEMDWKKTFETPQVKTPRMMPIFWGNARLLIGLVTAYESFGDKQALEAAKRLGDFYITSASDLMNPARDAEYRATGSYAPGYVTCYFPGIEGLARLYMVTKDARYLKQAERMADFFKGYDKLPLDHSHGNLIAYHGIMLLHEITGKPEYLKRAIARWEEAVSGGYVWPTGGVGEMFKPVFRRDEGCSEADWLRLNLDLWRATGQTRYLDMAERLLRNHYAMNMMPNGGYGHHEFIIDETGPLLMQSKFVEAVWCCTFHGLMGMNFFKSHVAAGSGNGVFVNFPIDAEAKVKASGRECAVSVKVEEAPGASKMSCRVSVTSREGAAPALFVRVPDWADEAQVSTEGGEAIKAPREGGYLKIEAPAAGKQEVVVSFTYSPRIENRRLQRIKLQAKPGASTKLEDVVLFDGPRILLANASKPRPATTVHLGENGKLGLLASDLALHTWKTVNKEKGMAFVYDLTVAGGEAGQTVK